MQADFGQFAGVVAAERVHEVILMEMQLDGEVLGETPFAIAAVGLPIGDVALSDFDADLLEGLDDMFLGNVVKEHAIDDVANGFGEARDFAVAGLFGKLRRDCGWRVLRLSGDASPYRD